MNTYEIISLSISWGNFKRIGRVVVHMYFVPYCQIKPWFRTTLQPVVNSRLINLSHQR